MSNRDEEAKLRREIARGAGIEQVRRLFEILGAKPPEAVVCPGCDQEIEISGGMTECGGEGEGICAEGAFAFEVRETSRARAEDAWEGEGGPPAARACSEIIRAHEKAARRIRHRDHEQAKRAVRGLYERWLKATGNADFSECDYETFDELMAVAEALGYPVSDDDRLDDVIEEACDEAYEEKSESEDASVAAILRGLDAWVAKKRSRARVSGGGRLPLDLLDTPGPPDPEGRMRRIVREDRDAGY